MYCRVITSDFDGPEPLKDILHLSCMLRWQRFTGSNSLFSG